MNRFFFVAFTFLIGFVRLDAKEQQISQDRELKELDLKTWDCLNRLEGSARTPDGVERNRLKNRSAADISNVTFEDLDTATFLKRVADFEAHTKGKRRKDLSPDERLALNALEKQIVQFTGYLGLASCGPPETTNCASVDFHDWHLEMFEKPLEHPPQIGDPTPIICEITPRTQNAIYHDNTRIQELTAFFRRADLTYEPTGHKARKIRLSGYLLWDDDHNGSADVGTNIRYIGANKYHHPWRSVAWEIHPVLKIEPADAAATSLPTPAFPAQPSPSPSAEATAVPNPTPPQFVTVMQPVKIKILYGEIVLPRGEKLPFVSDDAQNVTVQYMGEKYVIPVASTDLR